MAQVARKRKGRTNSFPQLAAQRGKSFGIVGQVFFRCPRKRTKPVGVCTVGTSFMGDIKLHFCILCEHAAWSGVLAYAALQCMTRCRAAGRIKAGKRIVLARRRLESRKGREQSSRVEARPAIRARSVQVPKSAAISRA